MEFNPFPDPLCRLKDAAIGAATTLVLEARDVDMSDEQALSNTLRDFGFSHPDAKLVPISRQNAIALIAHLVAYHQCGGPREGTLEIAEACAEQFIELFPDCAVFLTNSPNLIANGLGGMSLTDSTFDAGVIGIAPMKAGAIWFEDED